MSADPAIAITDSHRASPSKTNHRIRLRMTSEGWVYVIILLFIASGGLLRNINLLILLNGLMIAPVLIGWRLSVTMVSWLKVRRVVPKVGFVGQPVEVNWEVMNDRATLASWQLILQDQCQQVGDGVPWRRPESVQMVFPVVRPKEAVFQHYRIQFDRRGEYRFGPASIATRFPFGLMRAAMPLEEPASLFVAPAQGKLMASWDRRLLSRASGASSVRRKRGLQDDEFFALRQWRSGDSRKQVHWRTTAKFNVPMVRQFDSRTDKDFVLILDLQGQTGQSGSTRTPAEERVETALEFASTVFSRLQGRVFGQLTVAVCGQSTRIHSDHVYSRVAIDVLKSFALAQAGLNPPTLEAILEVAHQVSEGTPVYVVSTREFPEAALATLPADAQSRFRTIEPWLRWVPVDSDVFRGIFARAETVTGSSADAMNPNGEASRAEATSQSAVSAKPIATQNGKVSNA